MLLFLIFFLMTLMVDAEFSNKPVLVFENHQNVQCLALGKYSAVRKPCEKKLPNYFRCEGSPSYRSPGKYLWECEWKEVPGYAVTTKVNSDSSLTVNMTPHYDFEPFTHLIILMVYITFLLSGCFYVYHTDNLDWYQITFIIWLLWA